MACQLNCNWSMHVQSNTNQEFYEQPFEGSLKHDSKPALVQGISA
jgi:hypothetical protein